MWPESPLVPEQASTIAASVDRLYSFLIGISFFFLILIAMLILFFLIKYRRRSDEEQGKQLGGLLKLELIWSIIPLMIAMTTFAWGAVLFFDMSKAPDDALELFVVGKQWMWKIQHPEGMREINELHVPVGVPIRLTMTSEDVIHSFYVPAFRVKSDVLPGRYTSLWFEATKVGEYHLFCAEYCGTDHSRMVGKVIVMEPKDYQDWLTGGAGSLTLAQAGERLFNEHACHNCHRPGPDARGPVLEGRFGDTVFLQDGSRVMFDAKYVRDSIIDPTSQISAGFKPEMPTYKGSISEEGIIRIISYLKSLGTAAELEEQP